MKKDIWNTIVIISGIVSMIIILFGISVVIPASMSDGTDKLTGIARPEDMPFIVDTWSWTGIDRFSSHRPGGTFSWTIVERVEYTPIGSCSKLDDVNAYTITTKRVGLFGITTKVQTRRPPSKCGDL